MVLMTCCGERFADVRASMGHACKIEPKDIKAGDLGYYGDADGHWVVVAVTANWVHLETPDGADVMPIPRGEASDQNWLWYREQKAEAA